MGYLNVITEPLFVVQTRMSSSFLNCGTSRYKFDNRAMLVWAMLCTKPGLSAARACKKFSDDMADGDCFGL